MYAIVNIAGQQFKVQKDQQIFVHRLPNKEGEEVIFEEVLLIDNDGKVDVGAPAVSGAKVTAKVLEHLKGDKVIVFKKKRRKGYQKSNGHRQYLTKISIGGIAIGAPKKAATKAAAKASDDLTKIEGIGPKIAEVLANSGMNTFAAVAGSTAEEIKALLEAAGSKFAAHDPATWPQQAGMAAEGKWDELKAWQDELKGGKES